VESLEEVAYRTIKERIVNLTYYPGMYLTETGLANELNLSRQPVRVAVRQLAMEGLIVSDYYKKLQVRKITRKDVEEIYQLREMLEGNAMRLIFRQNREEEYSYIIEEKVVRMKATRNDKVAWEKADSQLHTAIIEVYENDRIQKIYQDNLTELVRIGLLSEKKQDHIKHTNERLEQMIRFMREGDFDRTYQILYEDHLILGKDMALEKITE